MFRDECEIEVVAGRGGDGMCSFRREKYANHGGPDGGDGGQGGDVVLLASDRVHSLLRIGRQRVYKAGRGRPGGPCNCSGRGGEDLVLEVPAGTLVIDKARGHTLRDLAVPGERLILAAGGHGGRGNARFATAVRQTPRRSEPGRDGERREVLLELKIVAEVGLVGLPNAGKSTLLATVTKARPKVAAYPFTTLVPHVGIATVGDFDTLVLADLPGLIEGAARGEGLGHQFLRHVERCRVLLHLVDCSDDAQDPVEAAETIAAELAEYSPGLAERTRLVVASKVEDAAAESRAEALEEALGAPVLRVSAHTGRGVAEVLQVARAEVRGDAFKNEGGGLR